MEADDGKDDDDGGNNDLSAVYNEIYYRTLMAVFTVRSRYTKVKNDHPFKIKMGFSHLGFVQIFSKLLWNQFM